MTFHSIGDLAASQLQRIGEERMNRNVYQEMKRLLGFMDAIKDKPAEEQIVYIRSHVATTAQKAASGGRVG